MMLCLCYLILIKSNNLFELFDVHNLPRFMFLYSIYAVIIYLGIINYINYTVALIIFFYKLYRSINTLIS